MSSVVTFFVRCFFIQFICSGLFAALLGNKQFGGGVDGKSQSGGPSDGVRYVIQLFK